MNKSLLVVVFIAITQLEFVFTQQNKIHGTIKN